MQDRFKTRIWDKTEKVMHYNDYVLTATGHIAKIQECSNDNSIMYFNQTDLDFEKDKILMFCTGLKDKNGKLIYEGDILQENWHKYILEWANGAYVIKDIKRGTSYMFTSGMCIHKSEVIGNIYENEELIKGVQNGTK